MENVPTSPQEWHAYAKKYGVKSMPIHDIVKLNSASKIKVPQFLALRDIWNMKRSDKVDVDKTYGIKYRAEDLKDLPWNKHWTRYVQEPVTTEEAKLLPLVKDEQIVNTAIILLLRGICLRMPGLEAARWSIERKAFHFGQHKLPKKKSLYEARTEGHFSLIDQDYSRSLAILEVKAQVRDDAEPWMQESAQMAAWIYDEPSKESDSVSR
ncbi:hypothetical protein AJ79_07147 [Helicocarpus griseus UAMH5409]|uniref:Uncharacterized protein n=1 Tax=Helicocarpus griseus UAMH5409 TaxID=1447875 RepID=A0A2B7X612_9EURO|nr:hypothetical protein AJ79_07147 [Helicocarpus griseus UAMH5409]